MPPNASLHGIAVDRLMRVNLIALGTLFPAGTRAADFWCAAAEARYCARAAERVGGGSVPMVLLCVLYAWMAFTAQRLWAANRFEGASLEALQVEVMGVQFQWYFRYPGEDAAFGTVRPEMVKAAAGNPLGLDKRDPAAADDIVASELVLPAGREVDLTLARVDVIHGFFVPAMRLKQNAVPGMVLHVHFTPQRCGRVSHPVQPGVRPGARKNAGDDACAACRRIRGVAGGTRGAGARCELGDGGPMSDPINFAPGAIGGMTRAIPGRRGARGYGGASSRQIIAWSGSSTWCWR